MNIYLFHISVGGYMYIIFAVGIILSILGYILHKRKIYQKNEKMYTIVLSYLETDAYDLSFHYEMFPFERKFAFINSKKECASFFQSPLVASYINKHPEINVFLKDFNNYSIQLEYWTSKKINEAQGILNSSYYFKRVMDLIDNAYFDYKTYESMIHNCDVQFKLLRDTDYLEKMFSLFVEYFDQNYIQIKNSRERHNKEFIANEKQLYSSLLSNIDGKALDTQQQNAVLIDENNTLVVAGAGSGKTLTIVGKVAYLTQCKNISPSDILLISYGKRAAAEMNNRMQKMSIPVTALTFHALGYSFLKEISHGNVSLIDEKFQSKLIQDYFENQILKEDKHMQLENYISFIAYFMYLPYILENEKSMSDIIDFSKNMDLETVFGLTKTSQQDYRNEKRKVIDLINQIITRYEKLALQDELKKKSDVIIKHLETYITSIRDNEFNYEEDSIRLDKFERYIIDQLSLLNQIIDLKEIKIEEHHNLLMELQELTEILYELKQKLQSASRTLLSLSGRRVKSYQELLIANFLFINGISFEYERKYPFAFSEVESTNYKPDFYLTDYDVYLEHFGVNADGKVPWLSNIEEKKYLDSIEWKRRIHKENKTNLIETYSFEFNNGDFISVLENKLVEADIKFKRPKLEEILDVLGKKENRTVIDEFYKLVNSFLSLYKSENYKIADFSFFDSEIEKIDKPTLRMRSNLFFGLFKKVYIFYQTSKQNSNSIDFDDMINKSIQLIHDDIVRVHPYKYIIVDEYQDISGSRVKLLKELITKSNAKLLCVGDDWQAIYGFTGSDVGYFLDFESIFGFTEKVFIENTYRNSVKLIEKTGTFVMRNPKQMKKHLHSDIVHSMPIIDSGYESQSIECDSTIDSFVNVCKQNELIVNPMYINECLRVNQDIYIPRTNFSMSKKFLEILKECFNNNRKYILVIGRTNKEILQFIYGHVINCSSMENKNGRFIKCYDYPDLAIEFMTAHGSKGTEADAVIVIGIEDKLTSFPSKMVDDVLLNVIRSHKDNFAYAEERRLFYVALTRTKNEVYLVYDRRRPSLFIQELINDTDKAKSSKLCPKCKNGELVYRKAKDSTFVGCSNFPSCDYVHHSVTLLDDSLSCPTCGGYLIRKNPKEGMKWKSFYGCTNYPRCETRGEIIVENGIESLLIKEKEFVNHELGIDLEFKCINHLSKVIKLNYGDIDSIRDVARFYVEKGYDFLLDVDVLTTVLTGFTKENLNLKDEKGILKQLFEQLTLDEIYMLYKSNSGIIAYSADYFGLSSSEYEVNEILKYLISYIDSNKNYFQSLVNYDRIYLELLHRLENGIIFNYDVIEEHSFTQKIICCGIEYLVSKYRILTLSPANKKYIAMECFRLRLQDLKGFKSSDYYEHVKKKIIILRSEKKYSSLRKNNSKKVESNITLQKKIEENTLQYNEKEISIKVNSEDVVLVNKLRRLRFIQSQLNQVSVDSVCDNETLVFLVHYKPRTIDELKAVKTINKSFIDRYGQIFIHEINH